jgi:Domain of Unknown Function (DUF928)
MSLFLKWQCGLISTLLLGCLILDVAQVAAGSWRYLPDPNFSALSRKGRPRGIDRGGGRRSGCVNLTRVEQGLGLTAVVPQSSWGGLSASTTPMFWFYVPYAAREPLTVVLSVRKVEGKADDFKAKPIQMARLQLPMRTGVVGLQLPQPITDRGLLEWSVTVICDEARPDRNPFVSGLVMIKPNEGLDERVRNLVGEEQMAAFARLGYWYDALKLVAGPQDAAAQQRLLKMAGLNSGR